MAGCWNDVQDLLTSVNDPDKTYPARICRSSGCDACECRMSLPEEVWIGEARHVSSWGNPDGDHQDRNVCHVPSGNVCHASSGERVPIGMKDVGYSGGVGGGR